MNAVLRKEIRLLMPAWLVAMVAAALPVWVIGGWLLNGDIAQMIAARHRNPYLNFVSVNASLQQMQSLSLLFFVAGALLLSLASFGLEMSFGTFSSLLAQPRARLKTWQMKIGLLAAGLALVSAAAGFSWWLRMHVILRQLEPLWTVMMERPMSFWPEYIHSVLLLALMAFVGGLWTTLLLRQTMTAFWFAMLVPFVLFYGVDALVEWLGVQLSPMVSFALVSCAYAMAGFFLARWLFFHAQDKPEREATDGVAWSFLPVFRTRRRPVVALLIKELRLQQGTLVIAVVLLLLHLTAVAALEFLPPAAASKYSWLHGIWLLWLLAPLLVACASVAEERRGRTLESTLCLPAGGLWQFTIKLLVVFGLGIFLGAVMPCLLELLQPVPTPSNAPIMELGLPRLLMTAVILTSLGCYGSSVSRTLLEAMGVAVLLGVVLLISINWVGGFADMFWPVLIAVSIYLSYANFKQLRITGRQWLLNGNVWLAAIFAAKFLWFILNGLFSVDVLDAL